MKISTKAALFVTGFAIISTFHISANAGNPNFLWEVVSEECVPNQKAHSNPDPCAEVTFEKDDVGYAVFKDYNGPLQFLLLPTTKISGIESPDILTQDSPNYFYRAWEARTHLEKIYGAPIPQEELSLTVNSQMGRSQNQLHIHISCTRSDVKNIIQQNLAVISTSWNKLPGGIMGHNYFARRVTAQELKEQNAFVLLANGISATKGKMNEFGLAMVAAKNSNGEMNYILLADQVNPAQQDSGHVEEIQDHQCSQLYSK